MMGDKTEQELLEVHWLNGWDEGKSSSVCSKVLPVEKNGRELPIMYEGRLVHLVAHSGALRIVVNDIVCSNCDHVNIFDGRSHGMLCLI